MPTNRFEDGGEAATSIDLAREASFALGHVTVAPATLSVEAAGWSQRLEPRAMQVLVVLAQAAPAVVGRGELNARVWGGRVVGEDAINRAVQTLRRVAADAPPPSPFLIETVPRVGYRLTVAPAGEAVATPPAGRDATRSEPAASPPRARRAKAVMGVAILLALLAATLVWRGTVRRAVPPVAWRIAGVAALDDLPPGAHDVALSPDGRRLAYVGQDLQGRARILVRAVDAGGPGDAVSPPEIDARGPAWSPTGADLAFFAYDAGRPCRLYVRRAAGPAAPIGSCETQREPRLGWSADGRSLLFGDKPGENAVLRIGAVRVADGQRDVLSSPPGNSVGDEVPIPVGRDIVFRRQFGWADEGWIARDAANGSERLLWRRRNLTGSFAAPLPGGTLAIAWAAEGASHLDLVQPGGRVDSQPVAFGLVAAISAAGARLLVETDHTESALARAGGDAKPAFRLLTMRGRITSPLLLGNARARFSVTSAGASRIWERDAAGLLQPWGAHTAATVAGLALSPDGRLTAALSVGEGGSEIVVSDPGGKPLFRWNPGARKLNPAAWSGDGRRLIVPMLDNAGWRLFALDPFRSTAPRDLGLPGFAVVQSRGPALYAVRAGETTGTRELWRLDGHPRRLAFDLTLFDIVNWTAADGGVWLPDRSDRDRPRLVLRDGATGQVLRRADAPGLAGAGSRLAADAAGPVYVRRTGDAFDHVLLTLAAAEGSADRGTTGLSGPARR